MEQIFKSLENQQLTQFKALPKGVEKSQFYYKHIDKKVFHETIIYKEGDNISYFEKNFMVRKSPTTKAYFKYVSSNRGISFKNKKLYLFGVAVNKGEHIAAEGDLKSNLIVYLRKLVELNAIDLEWLINEWQVVSPFMSKSLLQKIFNKKITNPIDFFKVYLKSLRIDASPRLFYKALASGNSKNQVLSYIFSARDINLTLIMLTDGDIHAKNSDNMDLIRQANIFEEKINWAWSKSRLAQEHQNYTEKLMKLEVESLEDEYIDYSMLGYFHMHYLDTTANCFKFGDAVVTPLVTKKQLFWEGSRMSHCIYTNYYERCKRLEYIVFNIKTPTEECTAGFYIKFKTEINNNHSTGRFIYLDQARTKRNGIVSGEMEDIIHQLNSENKLFIFTNNQNQKQDGNNKEINEGEQVQFYQVREVVPF